MDIGTEPCIPSQGLAWVTHGSWAWIANGCLYMELQPLLDITITPTLFKLPVHALLSASSATQVKALIGLPPVVNMMPFFCVCYKAMLNYNKYHHLNVCVCGVCVCVCVVRRRAKGGWGAAGEEKISPSPFLPPLCVLLLAQKSGCDDKVRLSLVILPFIPFRSLAGVHEPQQSLGVWHGILKLGCSHHVPECAGAWLGGCR